MDQDSLDKHLFLTNKKGTNGQDIQRTQSTLQAIRPLKMQKTNNNRFETHILTFSYPIKCLINQFKQYFINQSQSNLLKKVDNIIFRLLQFLLQPINNQQKNIIQSSNSIVNRNKNVQKYLINKNIFLVTYFKIRIINKIQKLKIKNQCLKNQNYTKKRLIKIKIRINQIKKLNSQSLTIKKTYFLFISQNLDQEYRIMNMEYLRNMVMGMRYQNGEDIDIDNMTYEQLLQLQEQMGSVSKGLTQQQIKKLPKKVFKQDSTQQLCSICYYHAKQNEQMTILPCNHTFHTDCIKQWLLKQKICPMCKQQIIMKIQSSKKLTVATNVQQLGKHHQQLQKQIEQNKILQLEHQISQKNKQSIQFSDSIKQVDDINAIIIKNMKQNYEENYKQNQLIQMQNPF